MFTFVARSKASHARLLQWIDESQQHSRAGGGDEFIDFSTSTEASKNWRFMPVAIANL